jgi:hypothetical protein
MELRVDIITVLALALLFDALLGETKEVAGQTYGQIVLVAYYLGCGLASGLRAPAQTQTMIHVHSLRWQF